MRSRNLAAVLPLLTLGCRGIIQDRPPEIRSVRFAPYLAPCPGVAAYPCLVDEDHGESYPTGEVRGFTFEWGVAQRVLLTRYEIGDPRVDTASWVWDTVTPP
jgi:hypothetical protein